MAVTNADSKDARSLHSHARTWQTEDALSIYRSRFRDKGIFLDENAAAGGPSWRWKKREFAVDLRRKCTRTI